MGEQTFICNPIINENLVSVESKRAVCINGPAYTHSYSRTAFQYLDRHLNVPWNVQLKFFNFVTRVLWKWLKWQKCKKYIPFWSAWTRRFYEPDAIECPVLSHFYESHMNRTFLISFVTRARILTTNRHHRLQPTEFLHHRTSLFGRKLKQPAKQAQTNINMSALLLLWQVSTFRR